MNVCSYVKKTMVNRRISIDVDLASTNLPCIPGQLLELDELFRIDLRNHRVAGVNYPSESYGFKGAKRCVSGGFRNRYEKAH